MNGLLIFRVAGRALLRNKLRSSLTSLGVVIGVAAVLAMVSIGEGAKARVQQSFAAMGTNLLIVMSGSATSGGARGGFGSGQSLTWDDLQAIRTELASVRMAAAQLRTTAQVMSDSQNWTTLVNGTSTEYFDIRAWRCEAGSTFSEAEVDGGFKVAVLGRTVADKLFGAGVDPVGQSVRIRNLPFEVRGVLEPKGQSPMGQDFDDVVIIPVTAFASKLEGGLRKFIRGVILVSAVSAEATPQAERQVIALLRDRHRIEPGAEDDFSVRDLAEMASAEQESTRTLTLLLLCIALVSLLVGGIGIMNIMLVSVTERTREIGLRMAVGARPRDILLQFLVEALTLSLVGGVLGIALGLGVAERLASRFDWPLLVRLDVIVIAVVFSAGIGVVFGLFPARRASRLDPIEALRFE
jgi:putative ABC transport system permease protein